VFMIVVSTLPTIREGIPRHVLLNAVHDWTHAPLAQWLEHRSCKAGVIGSNPIGGSGEQHQCVVPQSPARNNTNVLFPQSPATREPKIRLFPRAQMRRHDHLTPQSLDMTPRWCHYGDMELGQYVSDLQRQLVDTAANGAEDTRAVAERLASGLDAATRLVLLDALSAAVGEITRDLAPGSVDLRLRGREIEFVVSQPSTDPAADEPAASVDLDDASTSRTTLRLPDALKARVDDAASADGLSVNSWLVRAVAAALQPKERRSAQRTLRTGDNFAGWAR
jgi:hypothetical protein